MLIVDDEEAARESLRELLAAEGYETQAEEDGLAGLKRVKEFLPSVVLTDVLMPRMDGFELLREIRSLYPEMAVILLTGHGSV